MFTIWIKNSKVHTCYYYIKIHITESEEADNLEALKKTSAEEQAKLNKKKKNFKAQDSVLVEAMGKSMDEWKLDFSNLFLDVSIFQLSIPMGILIVPKYLKNL